MSIRVHFYACGKNELLEISRKARNDFCFLSRIDVLFGMIEHYPKDFLGVPLLAISQASAAKRQALLRCKGSGFRQSLCSS